MRIRTYLPKKYRKLFEKYRQYLERKKEEEITTYQLVQYMILKILKEWSGEADVGPS